MVGLLPERPQRGKGGYQVKRLRQDFEVEFQKFCIDIPQKRPTPEKALQTYLIGNAYQHSLRLEVLTSAVGDPRDRDLIFITDELALYNTEGSKVVCDILAARLHQRQCIPVLIELKSRREMQQLEQQLTQYAELVEFYHPYIQKLFSTLLGQAVTLSRPIEKWLIWPASKGMKPDVRERQLAEKSIRVVQYIQAGGIYSFYVGQSISGG